MATTSRIRSIWKGVKTTQEVPDTKTVHTKPNGAQSVREILFRNTSGMAYDNYKTPFYEEQATFSSQPMNVIQDMELSEKLQFLAETKANATALENKIKDYQAELQKLASQNEPVDPTPTPTPEVE